jgi:regulator of protease activity HflC (stomatin/prohibitin superfamily)
LGEKPEVVRPEVERRGMMAPRVKWWEGVIWGLLLLAACGLYYAGLTVNPQLLGYAWLVIGILIVILLIRAFTLACLRVLQDFEHMALFRRGRFLGVRDPQIVFVVPWIDTAVILDLRERHEHVSGVHSTTRDGVAVEADLSYFWSINSAERAAKTVAKLEEALRLLATTTVQTELAARTVDDVLQDETVIAANAIQAINPNAERWGVQVWGFTSRVRLPAELEDAFAKQVESYRAKGLETRARVNALKMLNEAAGDIDHGRFVMKLVALDTLSRMGEARSTKYILPMELAGLVRPLIESLGSAAVDARRAGSAKAEPQRNEPSQEATAANTHESAESAAASAETPEATQDTARDQSRSVADEQADAPDGLRQEDRGADAVPARDDGPAPTGDENRDLGDVGANAKAPVSDVASDAGDVPWQPGGSATAA